MYLLPANGKEQVVTVNLSDGTKAYVYGKLEGTRLGNPHDYVTGANKGYGNGFFIPAYATNSRSGDSIEINAMQVTSMSLGLVELGDNIINAISAIKNYEETYLSNSSTETKEPTNEQTTSYNNAVTLIKNYFE